MKQCKLTHFPGRGRPIGGKLSSAIQGGIAISALFTMSSPAVFAQTETAGGLLEEIVVTVRRRVEMATDVPISITAMTPDMLENRGITELSKLDTNVAGLNITTGGGGANTPLIALRGQRPSEILMSQDPAVPLYFSEVVLTPAYGTNLSMYDLANVQVLKGPQGTLFGRNSTGGAVLFTPKAPETEFGGYIKGTVGNYDLYKFEGAVNLPVNDVLGFRLSGQKTERDGYQSIVEGPVTCDDCVWDEDSYGLRLITSIDSGAFRNLTTMSYDENDSIAQSLVGSAFNPGSALGTLWSIVHNGGLYDQVPEAFHPALQAAGVPSERNIDEFLERQGNRSVHDIGLSTMPTEYIENRFFANNTEFDFSDELTIKNVFGYRFIEYNVVQDADGSPLPLFGSISIDTPTIPGDISLPSERRSKAEQFSNEIQLIGSTDKLDWLAGVYWFKMEGSEDFFAQNVGPNLDFPAGTSVSAIALNGLYNSSSESSVLNEAYAIFGEGTYTFTDEWSLTLGLRQTWDKRELTTHNRATDSTIADQPAVCDVSGEDDQPLQPITEPYDRSICSRTVDESFSSPTGRIAVNFTPAYGELYYASLSTGYRTGGFQTRGVDNFTLTPFDEETVITYELGHKADWDAGSFGNFRTAIALYWQDYQDIQKTQGLTNNQGTADTSDDTYTQATINAAEAVIRGVDLDVTWAPTDSLLFTLSYAYIDAYYKEWFRELDTDQDGDGENDLLDNKSSPFVYIPEHSVSVTAQYTLPLDPSLGDISLIANYYWQSKQDTFPEPQHREFISDIQGGWPESAFIGAEEYQFIDDYELWSFRINWESIMGSNFDASAYIDNAFDEEYGTGGINAFDSLGWIATNYGPPRTFGASLRWNF